MLNARDYAFNALEQKKYYESAAIFGTLIDRKSSEPEMYYGLAMALFNIDDYVSSLINFNKAGNHWDSQYYVGLINEYFARRAASFDEKVTLLMDSSRAYEKYGKQKHVPDAEERGKSVGIKGLKLYEKEIDTAISDTQSLAIKTAQLFENEITLAASVGLDGSSKQKRAETQVGLERLAVLNSQYQLLSADFNDKYPNAYRQKNYTQDIKQIEEYLASALDKENVINDGQKRLGDKASVDAQARANIIMACKVDCKREYDTCEKKCRTNQCSQLCQGAFLGSCMGRCR
jgi:hypothetical protein